MAAVPAPVASAAVPPPALALSPAAPPPPVVASAAEAPVTPAEPLAAKAPLPQRAVEFVTTNRNWLLALLLVPLAALGWAWRAHHLAYDKNGLPRGPRL